MQSCNKEKIRKLLIEASQKRYLELKSKRNMPNSLAFDLPNFSCPLFYETSLVYIIHQFNKIINRKRVNREP